MYLNTLLHSCRLTFLYVVTKTLKITNNLLCLCVTWVLYETSPPSLIIIHPRAWLQSLSEIGNSYCAPLWLRTPSLWSVTPLNLPLISDCPWQYTWLPLYNPSLCVFFSCSCSFMASPALFPKGGNLQSAEFSTMDEQLSDGDGLKGQAVFSVIGWRIV